MKAPIIITNLSSSYRSGQVYCICFAMAYNGWSTVIAGTWPGFTWSVASLITSIPCFIIAGVWAVPLKTEVTVGNIYDWFQRSHCRQTMIYHHWRLVHHFPMLCALQPAIVDVNHQKKPAQIRAPGNPQRHFEAERICQLVWVVPEHRTLVVAWSFGTVHHCRHDDQGHFRPWCLDMKLWHVELVILPSHGKHHWLM